MDLTHNEMNENENVVGLSGSGIKKGRKTIKNKIGFHLSLNDEQKHIKSDALTDTVSVFFRKSWFWQNLISNSNCIGMSLL